MLPTSHISGTHVCSIVIVPSYHTYMYDLLFAGLTGIVMASLMVMVIMVVTMVTMGTMVTMVAIWGDHIMVDIIGKFIHQLYFQLIIGVYNYENMLYLYYIVNYKVNVYDSIIYKLKYALSSSQYHKTFFMNYKHINYGFINMMFAFQVEIPVHAQMKCGVLMFDNCTEQNEIK